MEWKTYLDASTDIIVSMYIYVMMEWKTYLCALDLCARGNDLGLTGTPALRGHAETFL